MCVCVHIHVCMQLLKFCVTGFLTLSAFFQSDSVFHSFVLVGFYSYSKTLTKANLGRIALIWLVRYSISLEKQEQELNQRPQRNTAY